MARSYKIKSYKRIYRRSIGSIILRWLLALGGLALVFLLGWKLYEPLTDFFSGLEETAMKQETESEVKTEQTSQQKTQKEPYETPATVPETTTKPEEPPAETVTPPTVVEEETLPPITTPAQRTAYLSEETVLNVESFAKAISDAKASGMDSVMFDLKSTDGWVIYPIQYKEGIDDYYTAGETISLEEAAKQIREAGMKPIASIYAFKDRRFQQAETYAGILYKGSESFWLDNALDAGGKAWLNPYSPLAREYIGKLISDAVEAGFGEIVLREFRFPVGYSMDQMEFVYDEGQSKLDCLKEAADYFRTYAEDLEVDLWIEYPAANMNGGDTRPYGGDAAELLEDGCVIDISNLADEDASAALSTAKTKQPDADFAALISNEEQLQLLDTAGIDHYIQIK
ncbi:MAG: hypothetical protein IJ411_06315 [Oscillospiraceae bacterium]|nr:hypothetical protein [Oscillospiraceae bacterium]